MGLRYFLVGVAMLALHGAIAHAQPRVQIGATTRVELAPRWEDDTLVVEGTVRDDLGAPVPDAAIDVEFEDVTGSPVGGEAVSGAQDGSFRVRWRGAPSPTRVTARYGGGPHHDPSAAQRVADRARVSVRLALRGTHASRLDAMALDHAFTVEARSTIAEPGLDLTASIGDRVIARGRTDDAGRATLHVRPVDLGAPGSVRLSIRSDGDARRDDAVLEVPLVTFVATSLSLERLDADTSDEATTTLVGTLTSPRGPVRGAAVGIWVGTSHAQTVVTDARGRFRVGIVGADVDPDAAWATARFLPTEPRWGGSESAPVRLRASSSGDAPVPWTWWAASAVVTIALALLGGGSRRSREAGGRAPATTTGQVIETASRRSGAPSFVVEGRVIDARDGSPLAGAEIVSVDGVLAVADDAGRFAVRRPSGVHTMAFRAAAHADVSARVTVPHHGEWTGAVVRLRSLRDLAWDPLRPLAARWLPDPEVWGIWTGREVARAARMEPREAVDALVDAVERAAYAPTPPTRDDLREIVARADAVRSTSGRSDELVPPRR